MSNKLRFINNANAIGIILVVVGHCSYGMQYDIVHYSNQKAYIIYSVLVKIIYSFHMPLFMFLSGYLFGYSHISKKTGLGEYVLKRFNRLIIPYIIISSIAFPIKSYLSIYALRPVEFNIMSYVYNIIYPWNNVIIFLWFLPTVFIVNVCLHLIHFECGLYKYINNKIVIALFLSATALLSSFHILYSVKIFNIAGVCHYMIYAALGYVCSQPDISTNNLNKKYSIYIIPLVLFIFNTIYAGNYIFKEQLTAICGIELCILISIVIRQDDYLESIGIYAYQIFLLSWFPQIFFRILIANIIGIQSFLVLSGAMFIGGLFMPLYTSRLVRMKLAYFEPLIGLR